MSVLRPRNRLVNFRLSEEEFSKLQMACAQFGARSISDFARSSVLDRIEDGPATESRPQQRVNALGSRVMELESRVSQLLNLMEGTSARSATSATIMPVIDHVAG